MGNGGGRFATKGNAPPGKEEIMNALTKWDPFKDWDPVRELDEFQNRLTSFFGQAPAWRGREGNFGSWAPAVDIIEDDKEFLVKADLPEVKKEDLQINVENGMLVIHGERKFEREDKKKRYHRTERSFGSFTRSFSLPEGADSTKIRAEFKDGLLQVHIPKSEMAKPKQIEVKVE